MELDKFKRRLIRGAARFLLEEKRPEDEMWEQLKQETGCNCKLLWQRMRALTAKKLKRLLVVNDKVASLATVARLSATDWLLFDLVLVHESLDVIGRDKLSTSRTEYKSLMDLFSLVQEFGLEGPNTENLAQKWYKATTAYNRDGKYCSAMLLQRRWFQLKELTRNNFYNLWFNYRGINKLWEQARVSAPTHLQMAIAKSYPHVVTEKFLSWQERIEAKQVILPNEFEAIAAGQQAPKERVEKKTEKDADLVLVEPVIETIDLGVDSDAEAHDECERTEDTDIQPFSNEENGEDCLSNIKILETTHIPNEKLKSLKPAENLIANVKQEYLEPSLTDIERRMMRIKGYIETTESLIEQVDSKSEVDTRKVTDDGSNKHNFDKNTEELTLGKIQETKVSKKPGTDFKTVTESCSIIFEDEAEDIDDAIEESQEDNVIDSVETEHLIQQKLEAFFNSKEKITPQKIEDNNVDSDTVELDDDEMAVVDDMMKQKTEEFFKAGKTVDDTDLDTKLFADINIDDNSIAFLDDGIEYVDEDDSTDHDSKSDQEEKPSISPTNDIDKDTSEDKPPKFDLKLLMTPVIFLVKLENFSKGNMDSVKDKTVIDKIESENKPILKHLELVKIEPEPVISDSDDTQTDDIFESDNCVISELQKVKLTSYLLQKPRNRTYNPIQLCKNPDFNTRLKRLPVGFFTHQQNTRQLKACKPMTIDVSKAFESKLIQNTLYLKSHRECTKNSIKEDNIIETASTVLPSAMPMQSLIDNTTIIKEITQSVPVAIPHDRPYPPIPLSRTIRELKDQAVKDLLGDHPTLDAVEDTQIAPINETVNKQVRTTSTLMEHNENIHRNKIINLPDISKVRKINQSLLTAQVPPIRVQNTDDAVMPSIMSVNTYPPKTIDKITAETMSSDSNEKTYLVEDTHDARNFQRGQEQLVTNNTSKSFVDKQKRTAGRPPNPNSSNKIQKVPKKTSLTILPRVTTVPWNKRFINAPKKTSLNNVPKFTTAPWNNRFINATSTLTSSNSDALLTLDTLSKMLLKLNGSEEVRGKNKTTKLKKKMFSDEQKMKKCTQGASSQTKDISKKYCCWFKFRMETSHNKRKRTSHNCPVNMCVCCCKDLSLQPNFPKSSCDKGTISLSDDEDTTLQNACASIESVVNNETDKAPTPIIKVLTTLPKHPDNITKNPTSHGESSCDNNSILLSDDENTNLDKACASSDSVVNNETEKLTLPVMKVDSNPNITNKCIEPCSRSVSGKGTTYTATVTSGENRPISPKISDKHLQSPPLPPIVPITKAERLKKVILMPVQSGSNITQNQKINVHFPKIPFPKNSEQTITPESLHSIAEPVSIASTNLAVSRDPMDATDLPSNHLTDLTAIIQPASTASSAPYITIQPGVNSSYVNVNQRSLVLETDRKQVEGLMNYNNLQHYNNLNMPNVTAFYVGKNKILLTDVRFPKHLLAKKMTTLQPAKIGLPTVPAGVQLVLSETGEVTFYLEPGVELDAEQLALLPAILSTVQKHVNSMQKAIPATDPDLTKVPTDELAPVNISYSNNMVSTETTLDVESGTQNIPVNNESNKNNETDVSNPENIDGLANTVVSQVTDKPDDDKVIESNNTSSTQGKTVETNQCSQTEDTPEPTINSEPGIKTIEEVTKQCTNAINDKCNEVDVSEGKENVAVAETPMETTSTTGARNLLSDLMEMSGISAEDTTPVQPEPMPDPVIEIPDDTGPPIMNYTGTQLIHPIDLSSVRSLSELKYACDNGGTFFTLDLETGHIKRTNVSIRKSGISRTINVGNITPSATVDLTADDNQSNITPNATNNQEPVIIRRFYNKSLLKPKPQQQVTPIKLIKTNNSKHQISLLRKRIVPRQRKNVLMVSSQRKPHKRSRKQNLNNIEAKIDLVDSDAPMEEEYLLDYDSDKDREYVFDLDNNSFNRTTGDEWDASSDDEPLSQIAKKMRYKEDAASKDNVVNNETNSRSESSTDCIGQSKPVTVTEPMEVDEELCNDVDVTPEMLEFESLDTESTQDDCILGV